MTFQATFQADGGRNEGTREKNPVPSDLHTQIYSVCGDRRAFRKYSPRRLCFHCLTVVDAGQTRESVAEEMKTGESWKRVAHKMKKQLYKSSCEIVKKGRGNPYVFSHIFTQSDVLHVLGEVNFF